MAADTQVDVVIVAAGASQRMGGMDKLDAPLLGRPLLSWTVEHMRRLNGLRRLLVVVAPHSLDRYRASAWLARSRAQIVAGGTQRSESVLAGVSRADADIVLVHDGARPLASTDLARRVARAAAEHGAAVPVVPIVDSIKRITDGDRLSALDRRGLVRAQTPQGTRRELLLDAFSAVADRSYSDEASLLESHGVPVVAVDGELSNIKVTEPADLDITRALLAARAEAGEQRAGIGQDSHPFGPGDGLRIGGIVIDEAPRLYGHSDGDALLHALASAILAAAGRGDLGRHFPAGEPATAGAASTTLLDGVLQTIAADGWQPRSAQLSLLGARPHFGAARLDQMRERIADLLGLSPTSVALTASSGNLTGPEGAGLALSATTSVTIGRA
jgi:2-C-methyl-D-erythritol 4-phosphate cytidylyltransferase / 2-C-methyl-D-erythritol 2,4-cyclodiphosphate synthase